MLPLYFNYLSTLTLRVLQTHETQCGLPRLTPEDMQYTSTVPRRAAALETARQDALGSGLCGVTGSFGVRGTGEPPPPPPSPTPDQNRHAMLPISLSGCPREEDHTDEKIKAGRLKSHFSQKRKKKKGSTLDCCICSLWRLTKCSACRIAGLETWMMRERGGVGWAEPRGCPAAVQGPAPVQSRASFALPAGAPARQGAGRSSGPRPRSTAQAAAVARRAETTKDGPWVTPAPRERTGPPHTEATEHSGRAGRGALLAGLGLAAEA